MPDMILSGGRSGAERAAWRAARAFGVATGGWMPAGFGSDDGPHPEFAELYSASDLPTDGDDPAYRNVQESDGTLWIGATTTSAAQVTVRACQELGRTCLPIDPGAAFGPSHVAAWILEQKIRVLNVAGNREPEEPGIGERVERLLGQVLRQLGHRTA
jgi:hypothetical protein